MDNRLPDADFKTILDDLKDRAKSEMFCAFPGVIESFDSASQTATVSISRKKLIKGGTVQAFPMIEKCPVVVMAGGSAAVVGTGGRLKRRERVSVVCRTKEVSITRRHYRILTPCRQASKKAGQTTGF